MKLEAAIKKSQEIGMKMQEHANTATLASRTYTATMELYHVAAAAGDEKAMEAHRQTLHTTVDTILDSGAMIALLQRDANKIANEITF